MFGTMVCKQNIMQINIKYTRLQNTIIEHIYNGRLIDLISLMDRAVNKSNPAVLMEMNTILADPSILSLLTKRILSSKLLFNKLLKQSYYHENGFHKIVLLSGNHFKLRLHHFGVAAKIPMENIHDHRWYFASSILLGSLKMDMFQVSEDPIDAEPLYHFIYNSNKANGCYTTQFKGHAYLKKTSAVKFNQGDHYLMTPNELHRIKNQSGEESVTLILTGKTVGDTCNLFSKRDFLEEEKEMKGYEAASITAMLTALIEIFQPQLN